MISFVFLFRFFGVVVFTFSLNIIIVCINWRCLCCRLNRELRDAVRALSRARGIYTPTRFMYIYNIILIWCEYEQYITKTTVPENAKRRFLEPKAPNKIVEFCAILCPFFAFMHDFFNWISNATDTKKRQYILMAPKWRTRTTANKKKHRMHMCGWDDSVRFIAAIERQKLRIKLLKTPCAFSNPNEIYRCLSIASLPIHLNCESIIHLLIMSCSNKSKVSFSRKNHCARCSNTLSAKLPPIFGQSKWFSMVWLLILFAECTWTVHRLHVFVYARAYFNTNRLPYA